MKYKFNYLNINMQIRSRSIIYYKCNSKHSSSRRFKHKQQLNKH